MRAEADLPDLSASVRRASRSSSSASKYTRILPMTGIIMPLMAKVSRERPVDCTAMFPR